VGAGDSSEQRCAGIVSAELSSYDGTDAPTRVADMYSGPCDSNASFLTTFDSKLYFQANGGDGAGY
jgi:hypothetical protein